MYLVAGATGAIQFNSTIEWKQPNFFLSCVRQQRGATGLAGNMRRFQDSNIFLFH
jgi:hypothetical protein